MSDKGSNVYLLMLGDAYPYNVFEPEFNNGHTIFSSHWHESCLEIIMVTRGEVELHIGGKSFIGVPGDIFLIEEGVIHSGYVVDEPPGYYTILLDRDRLASSDFMNVASRSLLTGHLRLPARLRSGEDAPYEACALAIRAIINEFTRKAEGYEIAMKSYLHILLLELARSYGEFSARTERRSETAERNMERLKEAITYIESNYRERLTVGATARVAGMSPYYFCRMFKHAVGRTFTEFIHLYRIGQAETLIRTTGLPISLIAERTGFGTVQYLDELFKRYKGCTPTQLRKQTLP